MGSNPEVAGVITEKVILAAGLVQSTLWRGLLSVSILQCSTLHHGDSRVR